MFKLRNAVLDARSNIGTLTSFTGGIMLNALKSSQIKCFESTTISYSNYPPCVDLNYISDYRSSQDEFKLNLAHSIAVLHGGLNAANDRSKIASWQGDSNR